MSRAEEIYANREGYFDALLDLKVDVSEAARRTNLRYPAPTKKVGKRVISPESGYIYQAWNNGTGMTIFTNRYTGVPELVKRRNGTILAVRHKIDVSWKEEWKNKDRAEFPIGDVPLVAELMASPLHEVEIH